jgi:hypothetical protein
MLDELVLLIQYHMADITTKVAFSADVTSLATAVAGLCDGFESPSAVNVHWNARGSVHEEVCIAAGVVAMGGACEWRKENRVCRGAECVIGKGAE